MVAPPRKLESLISHRCCLVCPGNSRDSVVATPVPTHFLRIFKRLHFYFPDLATRKCSTDGFWISEDGTEAVDPSWTNFTGCFTADVAKVIDGYYGTNSSSNQLNIQLH